MGITGKTESGRFQSGAHKYAAYLETPEGRLRSDLALANLQEFLPLEQAKTRWCALDIGGGTGAAAVRLARLGFRVTLLDSSEEMLGIAKIAVRDADASESVVLKHGNAAHLTELCLAGSFDLILCHNILEYVDDPGAVLQAAAHALRRPSGIMSVLVRNQTGEVLKSAIQAGDLELAERNLTAEWGKESLYGGNVRLFSPRSLRSVLNAASLEIIAERGVRVVADYLPPSVSRTTDYQRILDLERTLGKRPEFAAIARYTHCFARPAASEERS